MGDKKGAIATAEESKKVAIEGDSESYVVLNDKLIAKLKGKNKK